MINNPKIKGLFYWKLLLFILFTCSTFTFSADGHNMQDHTKASSTNTINKDAASVIKQIKQACAELVYYKKVTPPLNLNYCKSVIRIGEPKLKKSSNISLNSFIEIPIYLEIPEEAELPQELSIPTQIKITDFVEKPDPTKIIIPDSISNVKLDNLKSDTLYLAIDSAKDQTKIKEISLAGFFKDLITQSEQDKEVLIYNDKNLNYRNREIEELTLYLLFRF